MIDLEEMDKCRSHEELVMLRKRDRAEITKDQVFLRDKNIQLLSRKELLQLSMDLLRFPNVNHVEIRDAR